MSSLSRIAHLEGPEDWHVMISHHKSVLAKEISTFLDEKELSCCNVDLDTSQSSTEDYVWRSRVILVILSSQYVEKNQENDRFDIIREKVKMLGQSDRLLLVNDMGPTADVPAVFYPINDINTLSREDPNLNLLMLNAVNKEIFVQDNLRVPSTSTGATLALSYYYGYLRLVLPKWGDGGMDIHERIRKSKFWNARLIPEKMIIVLLESCKCPPSFSSLDAGIQPTKHWLNCAASRSGHPSREYRVPISSFSEGDRTLYAAADLSTSVLTLYEMMEDPACDFTPHQRSLEIKKFFYTLDNILANSGLNLQDKYSIVYVKDETRPDVNVKQLLMDRIQQEILDDLRCERDEREYDYIQQIVRYSEHHIQASLSCTAATLQAQERECYQLRRRPNRGSALIISLSDFDSNSLRQREGAQYDLDHLCPMLEKLEYDVHVHNQSCGQADLVNILQDISKKDHSMYDSFVCFLLTHGRKGAVICCDGETLSILKILELFYPEQCPTLRGKPKAFFIQACQVDEGPDQPLNEGTALAAGQEDNMEPSPMDVFPIPHPVIDSVVDQPTAMIVQQTESTYPSTRLSGSDAEKLECDGSLMSDSRPGLSSEAMYVPSEEDFLIGFATIPGRKAWRDVCMGSVYISHLVEEMSKVDSGMDLISILDTVKEKVTYEIRTRLRQTTKDSDQVPFYVSTLSKRLCFDLQP